MKTMFCQGNNSTAEMVCLPPHRPDRMAKEGLTNISAPPAHFNHLAQQKEQRPRCECCFCSSHARGQWTSLGSIFSTEEEGFNNMSGNLLCRRTTSARLSSVYTDPRHYIRQLDSYKSDSRSLKNQWHVSAPQSKPLFGHENLKPMC